MKSFTLLLLISSIILLSCSSDDDSGENKTSLLSGKWQFGKTEYFYTDGSEETINPTECDLLSNYQILENTNIIITSYVGNGNSCELESTSNVEYFRIDVVDGTNYTLISKEINETERQRDIVVNFLNDNLTMIWTFIEDDPVNLEQKINYFSKIN